jgi:hypothetical protein
MRTLKTVKLNPLGVQPAIFTILFSYLVPARKTHLPFLLFAFLSLMTACKDDDVSRNDFTGRYELTETSNTQGSTRTFEINIRKSTQGDDQVTIENFYGAGITVNATLSNSRIIIPEQEAGDFMVNGIGSLSGSDLTLTYDVQSKGTSIIDYCSATGKHK